MRIFSFKSSGDGGEVREYKMALKEAKKSLERATEAVDTICELSDEMEDEYSERGDYGRYSRRGDYGYGERGGYYRRDDREWDDMHERRRDSRGRYM